MLIGLRGCRRVVRGPATRRKAAGPRSGVPHPSVWTCCDSSHWAGRSACHLADGDRL